MLATPSATRTKADAAADSARPDRFACSVSMSCPFPEGWLEIHVPHTRAQCRALSPRENQPLVLVHRSIRALLPAVQVRSRTVPRKKPRLHRGAIIGRPGPRVRKRTGLQLLENPNAKIRKATRR